MKKQLSAVLSVLIIVMLTGCTSEYDQMMEACEEEFPVYAEEMTTVYRDFYDTLVLADTTARVSLSPLVREMQSLRRDAERITPPECAVESHEGFIEGADVWLQLFLDFMADADYEPDDLELMGAQIRIEMLGSLLESYDKNPETFFDDLRAIDAEMTAEADEAIQIATEQAKPENVTATAAAQAEARVTREAQANERATRSAERQATRTVEVAATATAQAICVPNEYYATAYEIVFAAKREREAGDLLELRRLRDTAEELKPPPCAKEAHDQLIEAMEAYSVTAYARGDQLIKLASEQLDEILRAND